MADQTGWEIKGQFFPDPESFRMGDPVLVEQVTGLDWPSFTERLDDPAFEQDLVLVSGLVAVAIWQQRPQWRRDRVARYVETLDIGAVKFIGGDAPEAVEENDESPPEGAAPESDSETPPPSSTTPPASSSESTSPSSSGADGSDTGQDSESPT